MEKRRPKVAQNQTQYTDKPKVMETSPSQNHFGMIKLGSQQAEALVPFQHSVPLHPSWALAQWPLSRSRMDKLGGPPPFLKSNHYKYKCHVVIPFPPDHHRYFNLKLW